MIYCNHRKRFYLESLGSWSLFFGPRLEKSGEAPLLNSGADTRRRIQYGKERALQIARVHASRCRVGRRPRSLAAKCEDLPQRDLTAPDSRDMMVLKPIIHVCDDCWLKPLTQMEKKPATQIRQPARRAARGRSQKEGL